MRSLTFVSQIGDLVNAKSSKGFSRLTPGLSYFSTCGWFCLTHPHTPHTLPTVVFVQRNPLAEKYSMCVNWAKEVEPVQTFYWWTAKTRTQNILWHISHFRKILKWGLKGFATFQISNVGTELELTIQASRCWSFLAEGNMPWHRLGYGIFTEITLSETGQPMTHF